MSIKSYLAHPHKGRKNELLEALASINNCEVITAKNKDLLIIITDTQTDLEEDILQEQLETIKSLKLLAMVSGFNTAQNEN